MRYYPLYDVPLHIRVGVLMFQALGALVLGMAFYALYRIITIIDEEKKEGQVN